MKSTVNEIRERFDHDVDRFSDFQTGQSSTIDAPLCMELVAEAAAAVTPGAASLLDIGCGAGNYTLKLLERLAGADATLLDLSGPMLERAAERVGQATAGRVTPIQADIREAEFAPGSFDVAVAAAVLHHLRSADEWSAVMGKLFEAIRPGGSLWIVDLVTHTQAGVQSAMWRRYGTYLSELKDPAYRDHVFDYIEREDSPIPLMGIIDHLRVAGFVGAEVLHKHNCFAALGAVRPA